LYKFAARMYEKEPSMRTHMNLPPSASTKHMSCRIDVFAPPQD
jgi:hypothetical protein